ncbi:MAG: hypothetical protein ACR2O7_01200 [Parasphingorhabdus sp.]
MNRFYWFITCLVLVGAGIATYNYVKKPREIPYFDGDPNPSICLDNVKSINFIHWKPDWARVKITSSRHSGDVIQKEIRRLKSQIWDGPNEILEVTNIDALFPQKADTFSVIVYEDENAVLRSFSLVYDNAENSKRYADRMFREGNHPPQTAPRILGISLDVDRALNPDTRGDAHANYNRLIGYISALKKMATGECTGPGTQHISNVPNALVQRKEASE